VWVSGTSAFFAAASMRLAKLGRRRKIQSAATNYSY
jgi:hypothetical protein